MLGRGSSVFKNPLKNGSCVCSYGCLIIPDFKSEHFCSGKKSFKGLEEFL